MGDESIRWSTISGITTSARSRPSAAPAAHARPRARTAIARRLHGRFGISNNVSIAVCASRDILAILSPVGVVLTIGAVLAAGSLLFACSGGSSTTVQGAAIGSERGATGIYSGREWEIAKRYSY